MKAITFLGANAHYNDTVYCMQDGRAHLACYSGVAIARFFPDLQMRVFVTEKAREQHYPALEAAVADYVEDVQPVDISDGKNEDELWQNFETFIGAIDDGEPVIFDITHGYRVLPFLSFIAAAYLREVKRVDLHAVLYGNWEARSHDNPPRTPMIDMTAFVTLFDWMVAANRFDRFGDSSDLADLVRRAKPPVAAHDADKRLGDAGKALSLAASSMTDVSRALRLIRADEAMQASYRMQSALVDAAAEFTTHARPFVPLAQRVADAYAPIALDSATAKADFAAALARERTLVEWYVRRKQYVQALAVAREWIISWLLVTLQAEDLLDKELRRGVETELGRRLQARRTSETVAGTHADGLPAFDLSAITGMERVEEVYDQIGNLRNDLLHAGKRKGAQRADEKLEARIQRLCGRLSEFPVTPEGAVP